MNKYRRMGEGKLTRYVDCTDLAQIKAYAPLLKYVADAPSPALVYPRQWKAKRLKLSKPHTLN